VLRVRAATLEDVPVVLPRNRALNAQEEIAISDELLEASLRRLLGDPSLGGVWLLETDVVIGYAIVTFGYDLEFGGRDSYLTELWIDEEWRARGFGREALELLAGELRGRDIRALHLQVRPDNPALRLYERAGFTASPRVVMTRRLV
jgi:ribosomal protein S18 acetylase RimI-like enzyme